MRIVRAILILLTATIILSCEMANASTVNSLPQKAHGLSVTTLESGVAGAVLQAEAVPRAPSMADSGMESGALPFSSGLVWALPFGTNHVEVSVENAQWRSILPDEVPDSVRLMVIANPLPLVGTSRIMSLRGILLTSVAVNALQPTADGTGLRVCEHFDIRLSYQGAHANPDLQHLSYAMYQIAKGAAGNLDDVVPAPENHPEPYLIITRPFYAPMLASFVNWKRARGHSVTLATTNETGTTNQQIKDFIQNAYLHWPEPPVFVLLVGDVDGTNSMPAWQVPGYYHPLDISDHPYTLLEGDDYLPDLLIGRFSVDNGADIQTVVNKCVNYEKQPYQPQGAWRTKMLITGVQASPYFYPDYSSAWPTLQWIGRQCLENGFTQVVSIPYPPGTGSQISSAINNGVSFVAYRGFGEPGGWDGPSFTVNGVRNLTNGQMLPVVTSIVCGGGAFDSNVDPCFGEQWLRDGTSTSPSGAIGFIGPSEIDTKTRWNNTNVAGIYQGILFENIQTLSAAMLRGKMELLQEFPNNADNMDGDADRSVNFYFNVYNLLGDPGLTFFVGQPRNLSATIPASVSFGSPTVTTTVMENGSPIPMVWGTVTRSDSVVISRALSDSLGNITLVLPQDLSGTVQVTLTKPRFMPQLSNLDLVSQATVGTVSSTLRDNGAHGSTGNGDSLTSPGECLAYGIILHNFGSNTVASGTLTVTSENAALVVSTGSAAVGTLAPNSSSDTLWFTVDVASACGDGQVSRLHWQAQPSGDEWETTAEIAAPLASVVAVNTDGTLENPNPHTTTHVALDLANIGHAVQPAVTVTLHSRDPRLVVTDSVATYPVIPAATSAGPSTLGYHVTVGDFYPGDVAATDLEIQSPTYSVTVPYLLPIGNLVDEDPTHPDTYGYRAFQSIDTGFYESPDYAWLEINPTLGGQGTALNIRDHGTAEDTTVTVTLPFAFTFYGRSYTQLSICSNGFVSFGQTAESFFRNYSLPAIASPDNMVCVMWDDLYVPSGGAICTYHDTEGGRFVVEWSRLRNNLGSVIQETFQLILCDTTCWPTRTGDGDLIMQYQDFNNVDTWDNYSTIGIQDRDGGHALQITYAGSYGPGAGIVRSGQSIRFTTGRPAGSNFLAYDGCLVDDDTLGGTHGNGDGIPQNGETVGVSFRLRNLGGVASPATSGTLRTPDAQVTLLDSAVTLPAISPGETGTTNPVRMILSSAITNGHVSNFSIRLGAGVAPCVALPSFVVRAPELGSLSLALDDDSTGASLGNGDGEVNSGETLELLPSATNFGGNVATGVQGTLSSLAGNLTLVVSSVSFPPISPDSVVSALQPFVVRVAIGVANGTVVTVHMRLADAIGNSWTQDVDYMVVQSVLSAAGARIADPTPGGNGDGHLDLGETGEVYPRILNSGLGTARNVLLTFSVADTLASLVENSLVVPIVSPNSTRESAVPIHITIASEGRQPRNIPIAMTINANNRTTRDTISIVVGDAVFFDDYEASADGWSSFGQGNAWHVQSSEYHSPMHAYRFGNEGTHTYPAWANATLASPTFSFAGTGMLIFSTRYACADAGDYCTVELQTAPSGYNLLGRLTGTITNWGEVRYPLSGLPAYVNAKVRFTFTSNGTGTADGWFLDDIIVLDHEVRVEDKPQTLVAQDFELAQCYPNPFNDQTTIRYSIPHQSHVRITLCDLEGRRVASLVDDERTPGEYSLSWHPISLASGLYFVHLEAAGTQLTGKVVYLK